MRQICESSNEQIFLDLLLSSNWREVLVGVYCAITLQAALFHPEDLPPGARAGSPHSSFEQVDRAHQVASQLTEQLARLLVPGPGEPFRPLVTRPICIALALGRNTAALDTLLAHRPVRTEAIDEYAAALTGIQLLKAFSDEEIEQTYAEVLNDLRQHPFFDQDQFQESKNRCARALSFWAAGLAKDRIDVPASGVPHTRSETTEQEGGLTKTSIGSTTLEMLRIWGRFGTTLAEAQRKRTMDWDPRPIQRMIELASAAFALEAEQLLPLLEESDKRLRPFGDPLHVDFRAHRWLEGDREETYSDWLQWVVQQLETPELVFQLFGTKAPDGERPNEGPTVEREVWVPQGHAGHTGKIDLVIRFGQWAILTVEVKTGGADASDTGKQEGYRAWLEGQTVEHKLEPVLLAVDAKDKEYAGGFRFVSWADVCLELRSIVPELLRKNRFTAGAMALAFVGAVEQNLLGFSAQSLKRVRTRNAAGFNSKVIDHLERFLAGGCSNERT